MKNKIANYDHQLEPGFKFNLKELHDAKVLNISMVKKLIAQGALEYIKIGNKTHVSRFELVKYFSDITKNSDTEITITNYGEQLPSGFKFSLRELENEKILDVAMAKKLIKTKKIAYLKIGNKLHITRNALIGYFNDNTHRKDIK